MEQTVEAGKTAGLQGISDERLKVIAQHGQILGIIHLVMGILTCLTGLLFLVYIVIGLIAAVTGAGAPPSGSSQGPPDWIFGAIFVVVGTIGLVIVEVIGALTIFAGRSFLKARNHTFLVVVQVLNLLNQPVGMILGVFGLIYLFNQDVRAVFRGGKPDPDILV